MGSLEDLATLRALVASEEQVAEGLDQYCLLVDDPASFGEADAWTDAPPRKGEAFAQDGSEHEFCLLEDGAVLLYTPLSDTPYVVVGADLREFLSLLLHGNGAHIGGLGYEYGRDEVVAELAGDFDPDDESSEDELMALLRLTEVFGLARWPDVGARLVELEARLGPT